MNQKIVDFMIAEGKRLKRKTVDLPPTVDYMGENCTCHGCGDNEVYAELHQNDEGLIAGFYICASCGYERSIV